MSGTVSYDRHQINFSFKRRKHAFKREVDLTLERAYPHAFSLTHTYTPPAEGEPRIEIQKRYVLGDLPDSIILHLQRFTMNMETFTTEKVNTR